MSELRIFGHLPKLHISKYEIAKNEYRASIYLYFHLVELHNRNLLLLMHCRVCFLFTAVFSLLVLWLVDEPHLRCLLFYREKIQTASIANCSGLQLVFLDQRKYFN